MFFLLYRVEELTKGTINKGGTEMKKKKCLFSVAMIVRDEEHNIRRALESIKDIADEIVVVDTGSKDKTPEIVREYTDKLYFHEWRDDFSEARNYSLKFPTCEWVFIFDADEEASENFRKNIREFLKNLPSDVNTIYIPTVSYMDWDFKRKEIASTPRIFRNGTVYFKNIVHNQAIYKGKVVYCPYEIYHYGYIWTRRLRKKKYQRTRNLILKHLEEVRGNSAEEIYYLIQLYKTESISDKPWKRYETGWKVYRKIMENQGKPLPLIAMEFMFLFGMENVKSGLYEIAEDLFKAALRVKEYIDPYFGLTVLSRMKEDWDGVKEFGEKFIEKYKEQLESMHKFQFTVYTITRKLQIISALATSYMMKGDIEKFKKALSDLIDYASKEKLDSNDYASMVDLLKHLPKSKVNIEKFSGEIVYIINIVQKGSPGMLRGVESNSVLFRLSRDSLRKLSPDFPRSLLIDMWISSNGDFLEYIRKVVGSDSIFSLILEKGPKFLLAIYDVIERSFDSRQKKDLLFRIIRESRDTAFKGIATAILGDINLHEGKFKEALSFYRKALELLPELSGLFKPVIEDLKTRLDERTEGVLDELIKMYQQYDEFIYDFQKMLPKTDIPYLYKVFDEPIAKYLSAINSKSKEEAKKLLLDLQSFKEKFPFLYFRLAKILEDEEPKEAFKYHVMAVKENPKLGDIKYGRYEYLGFYPTFAPPFKEKEEFVWAGNITEVFPTFNTIAPFRAWVKGSEGLLWAYPFPADIALKAFKRKMEEFPFENPFELKDYYLISKIFELIRGECVKIIGKQSSQLEHVLQSVGMKTSDECESILVLEGIEEEPNLKALIDNSKVTNGVLIFRFPNLKNRKDPIWFWPGFRVLRSGSRISKELLENNYETVIHIIYGGVNIIAFHKKR